MPISALKDIEPNSSSVSEIDAMRKDDDARLQAASNIEIDTKLINSQTNLAKAKVAHALWGILATPVNAYGYASRKINEIFNTFSEEQKNSLRDKINRLSDDNREIATENLPTLASATEALLYVENQFDLREMFENLIVNTIDNTKITHPSFVEIIKQLSSEEAKILKVILPLNHMALSECHLILNEQNSFHVLYRNLICLYSKDKPFWLENIPSYIDNWARLGLVTVSLDNYFSDKKAYDKFDEHPIIKRANLQYKDLEPPKKLNIKNGLLTITDFGKAFAKAISII
ncbi:DUF4393 domain-containing protein [Exercitatus varius]|uniref:DUF4393 domain-containing protein n=1 Tax=Exercitatus varius TaxID=67857 RepID=UPI00294B502B|nr:DUF4393 domain-containing protein [Exercitatus varius]MDG2951403.1 DUF4393 domain-containing protein [Exercitatus varius]